MNSIKNGTEFYKYKIIGDQTHNNPHNYRKVIYPFGICLNNIDSVVPAAISGEVHAGLEKADKI